APRPDQDQRARGRDDEHRALVHVGLDQASELVIAPLEDRLHAAWLAFAQSRADPESDSDRGDDRDEARDDAVVVDRAQRPAPEVDGRVCARSRLAVDHLAAALSPWRMPAAAMTSWAAAIPISTVQAAVPTSSASPIASALKMESRARLEPTKDPCGSYSLVITKPLAEPRRRPI